MRKKVVCLLCFLLLAGSLSSFHQKTAAANDDVTGIALEKEMRAMIELGIMRGYGEGVYQPKKEINRGEFAALIARALDLPAGTPAFRDVSETALAPDIYRASTAGIINGYSDGTFRMEMPITRAQMAMMIDNALTKYLKLARKKAPLAFIDRADIGGAAFQEAVSRAVYDEIVLGFSYPEGSKFLPKKSATRAEAAAFIYRMLRTWKPEYKVATVNGSDQLVEAAAVYSSYGDASNAASGSNQVITKNDKIVGMTSGIVITKPPFGSALTNIYSDSSFSYIFTYLPAQQELEFVRATEDYVEVKAAGKTGYVKQREVSLIPDQQIKGRNYYSVNSAGDLVHWIYVPSGNYYQNYVAGKAPSFLAAGPKYYSWDGGIFYDASGVNAGTAYQYFNYLPARTASNYSAAELDSFINQELSRIEQLYNSQPTVFKSFKDATKKSKLIGLGNYLKEAEAKYKINALMILGMAIHESNFGMSYLAQDRNNLFGMNAIDGDENQAERFDSPERAIDALAERYLNKNYINPLGKYANGAAFGNKSRGFNVKYASDPYWGQKIAGHMYRADKALGGKDLGKYTIGETISTNIEVRHTPEEGSVNQQFTYLNERMPVAILESTNGWYKVISDHNDYSEAYINSQYVREMEIVK
ncbi:S-layer homology domain-containing protein [Bacillus benzoevorans]|uniref:Beta-N-acetylglucosaminidase n=1 Tax=Bacillus benzoevorans TaxID=1456 RepID=A0A7X0HUX5_9BACI|nr:S-layer homology domain-containing protein [Bacillus benzoevorans]MBB6446031.1 beta-N-acetylglucosaminidase [Bacillus benzoevorans]